MFDDFFVSWTVCDAGECVDTNMACVLFYLLSFLIYESGSIAHLYVFLAPKQPGLRGLHGYIVLLENTSMHAAAMGKRWRHLFGREFMCCILVLLPSPVHSFHYECVKCINIP